MKSLLLVILVSFFLASCGKTNSVATGSNVSSSTLNSVSSAVSTPTFADFRVAVSNGNFINEYVDDTYKKAIYYYKSTNASQSTILWGLVTVNSSSTSGSTSITRSFVKSTAVYTHELGSSAAEIRAKLLNLIDTSETRYTSCNNGYNNCFIVYPTTSIGYVIDLGKPLGANPVAKVQQTGTGGYAFVGSMSYYQ